MHYKYIETSIFPLTSLNYSDRGSISRGMSHCQSLSSRVIKCLPLIYQKYVNHVCGQI